MCDQVCVCRCQVIRCVCRFVCVGCVRDRPSTAHKSSKSGTLSVFSRPPEQGNGLSANKRH